MFGPFIQIPNWDQSILHRTNRFCVGRKGVAQSDSDTILTATRLQRATCSVLFTSILMAQPRSRSAGTGAGTGQKRQHSTQTTTNPGNCEGVRTVLTGLHHVYMRASLRTPHFFFPLLERSDPFTSIFELHFDKHRCGHVYAKFEVDQMFGC